MVSGIEIPSRRQVIAQRRNPIGRSSFRPAPIREIISTNSVMRSVATRLTRGLTLGTLDRDRNATIAPRQMQAIGSESGTFLRMAGSHVVRRTTVPNRVIRKMYSFIDTRHAAVSAAWRGRAGAPD